LAAEHPGKEAPAMFSSPISLRFLQTPLAPFKSPGTCFFSTTDTCFFSTTDTNLTCGPTPSPDLAWECTFVFKLAFHLLQKMAPDVSYATKQGRMMKRAK
jgi:hypothetical protein